MIDMQSELNGLLPILKGHAGLIFIIILVAAVVVSVVSAWMKKHRWHKELRREQILNRSEQRFYRLLREAMPDKVIFAQVSFNALVTAKRWVVRAKFNRLYADFVVCNAQDLSVEIVIELDGQTHDTREGKLKDKKRDKILKSVGHRVERFSVTENLSRSYVISRLQSKIVPVTQPS